MCEWPTLLNIAPDAMTDHRFAVPLCVLALSPVAVVLKQLDADALAEGVAVKRLLVLGKTGDLLEACRRVLENILKSKLGAEAMDVGDADGRMRETQGRWRLILGVEGNGNGSQWLSRR